MKNLIILKDKKVIFSFIAIFLVTSAALAEDSIIKIGVLAKRGPERCLEKWLPTAEYLSNKIPEKTFVIVPVDFDQTYSVVEKSEVDFILANPSFYVELESRYGINRIATLKNKVLDEIETNFGGVIFCKKQREDIRQYGDLKGKTFMAVEETSFGGWRMAWREFKEAGIDPFKDFASLSFGGTHDAVVYAVRDGKVDAGTVRTDTLERMNAEGKISIDDFHVIHEHGGRNVHLPFLHSTREYPEWPISKLKHTSNELAEKVAVALISMLQDSAAAQAARCAGWTIPLNYQSVHDCLKELKVGPYKDIGKITLTDIFRKYWILILINLVTLVVLAWFLAAHIILNRKIKTAYKELELEVNERIEAEGALRKSEERYRALFDHMINGVAIFRTENDGEDFIFMDLNKSGERIDNIRKKDLIGKNILKIYPGIKDFGLFDVFKRVWKTGKSKNYPVAFYKDKRVSGWRDNFVYKLPSGEIVAIYSDETERKRTEEARDKLQTQLSNAMEMAHLGHWEYDIANDLFTFNDHFYKIFRTTAKQVGGYKMSSAEYVRRFVHPDDMAAAGVETRKAVEATDPNFSRQLEHRMIYDDGTVGHLSVRFFLIKDAHGHTVKTYGVNQDITERKRLEEELLRAQKLESVGILAGGIAHDFNNILTTILGNVSLAKNQVTFEDEIFDLLNEAEMASTMAQTLTRQLLTFAKGGAPVKETASIKDILKESSSFVLRGSKSDCEFSMAENLWPAEVDVGQMNQVINNIVINANQAMPKGGTIQVAAGNLIIESRHGLLPINPGRYIRISITDQGIGIAENHLLNIFDPYFTTKQEGSGLGLATAYSIIKRHDGHITVESRLEVGTTFNIYLPASEKAVPEKEEVKLIKGRGRILMMDDEAPLRKIVKKILNRLGYKSEFAKDGTEAIEMYKVAKEAEKPYDAVILDLTIPGGMGGKEAINKLLEIDPEVKAIVSSGYSDDPVLANFQEYGFKGMMPKPFESRSLSKVLHEVLKGKGKD